ncbi:hypothetical protein [Clostridium sp. B9]|uniref:hypothetical protein n=1 Tax=Clostridium sp. B9 TaxID=3423224 RepID=UPI003D2F0219
MILKPVRKSELMEIFDETSLDVLRFYIKKAMLSQPEILIGQDPLSVQVPKEHIEQWIVQAIGGKPVGAGSYPVDIIHGKYGIDVKMLAAKTTKNGELANSDSGETSLAQKFTESGVALDEMFKERKYGDIVDGWKDILFNKLNRVCKEQSLEKIYYFFILRSEKNFHLCATSVDINEINNMDVLRGTDSSVFVSGLIDERFGNGKIYKAKKRLELRLKPKYWYEAGYTLDFDLDFIIPAKNIRNLIKEGSLEEYSRELYKFLINE